jgi:hypothetical protein
MLSQRKWEACLIDYTKAPGNIYEKESQIYCSRGKTYIDAYLGELAHSFTVAHASKHGAICGGKPTE